MSIETSKVYPYIKEIDENESELRVSTSYYLDLFNEYEKNRSYKIKWNMFAAIFGSTWLAYRAMYGYAMTWCVLNGLLYNAVKYYFSAKIYPICLLGLFVVEFIAFGCFGNRLYIRFIKKEMEQNMKPTKIGFRNLFYFAALSTFMYFMIIVIATLFCSVVQMTQIPHS